MDSRPEVDPSTGVTVSMSSEDDARKEGARERARRNRRIRDICLYIGTGATLVSALAAIVAAIAAM